jgi:signal transduction histidine kinase
MAEGLQGRLESAHARWHGDVLRFAAIAAAYFVVARLSLLLEFQPEGIAAIWPPAGLFLSAVLLTRREARPALVLVLGITDLIAERLAGTSWPVSAAYALALAGDASLSAWLLLRVLGAPPTFQRVRDFVAFVLLSVLVSNGLMSLVAAEASQHLLGATSYWRSWGWWAASGGIGNLIVTPLIMSTAASIRSRPAGGRPREAAELVAMLVLLAAVELVAFGQFAASSHFMLLLPYSSLPFQLWAALRLGVRGVAAGLVVIAVITVGFAAGGLVTSIHDTRPGAAIAVQLYLAIMALPSLLLAAVVAERRRSEEERERLRGQVEVAQRMEAVGRLSGGIAHDFNNMLTVILGRTHLALDRLDPAEPLHGDLREIREAALRSAELTGQLLAFARKQTVAPRVLDLNAKIADMLKMLRRLIGEEIELAFRPGEGLWSVRIDPAQVDQILANLCVNARDAIAGVGRISIETSNATLDGRFRAVPLGPPKGEYVMLAVSDDGAGMTKDVLEHVFEPFFTTKELGQGTGLGLATVYGILKQNDGAIDVYSEPRLGTTFKLYLPRVSLPPERSAPPVTSTPPRGRGETLLFVEDEAAIRSLGRAMLETLGYTVLVAGTPAEALRLAETHPGEIQLLLTDVVLPEMNGRELAARIQALRPTVRCLFMSGYSTSVVGSGTVLEEGIPFLQKPFSADALATKVRETLDRV